VGGLADAFDRLFEVGFRLGAALHLNQADVYGAG
jgi:hypothetical protein